MLTRRLIVLGFLLVVELGYVRAHAGALMPCIAATLSANNRILVVNELTFDDPDETHVRMPRTSTFRIYSRYSEINQGMRLYGPNSYWANPIWSVVFENVDRTPFVTCPYTLVTDDGEFLVLVSGGFIGSNALSIYRRRDHPGQPFGGPGPDHGVLIRQIALSELWPPVRIENFITDETPKWFAAGTFAFSADNRTLIHKTRWGQTLSIELTTGKVTNQ
jgi:hypothetical protein